MKGIPPVVLIFLACMLIPSCHTTDEEKADPALAGIDFKKEMRDFVKGISIYSKGLKNTIIIIPQNGHQLVTQNGESTGQPSPEYIQAIDGIGREDLFYGYDSDNQATSAADRDEMMPFLELARSKNVQVLVTDYCATPAYMDDSYAKNKEKGFISFAADHRELDHIPAYPSLPYQVTNQNVTSLAAAKNFLYLLNTANYASKSYFITAIKATNYDVVLMDLFFNEQAFTNAEIQSLKTKANGGKRLVLSYMSIGEAEDYRFYWNNSWKTNKPAWLEQENPDWAGNYKVYYWNKDWQTIIYGNDQSYTKKIIDAGFDGLYLDIIDAFEYFEDK